LNPLDAILSIEANGRIYSQIKTMNPKLLLGFALILVGGLVGCSTTRRHASSISPAARQVVQRMSDYYQHLNSFEGTNTIVDQSPTFTNSETKQFAFLRPNKFSIRSGSTNDWQWICDGTNFF
jgi:outer membrane lipoprotein-sorting protein